MDPKASFDPTPQSSWSHPESRKGSNTMYRSQSFESAPRPTHTSPEPLKGRKTMNRFSPFPAPLWRAIGSALAMATLVVLCATPAMAADNTATGDIAGGASTVTNSNTFTINSTTLALVKAAFLADGTPLASGTSVPRGSLVKFMIYLDNSTIVPTDSLNVSDVLAAQFAYQAGTLKVDNSQATGATAAAIYAAVNATAAVTDAVSGADVAGISGSTISAGLVAGNAIVNVPAQRVFAVLFSVKVQ